MPNYQKRTDSAQQPRSLHLSVCRVWKYGAFSQIQMAPDPSDHIHGDGTAPKTVPEDSATDETTFGIDSRETPT